MEHSDNDYDSISTIPIRDDVSSISFREEDSLSYEGEPRLPVNRHLYFDDAGREITRDEFLEQERESQEWVFMTTQLPERFVIRHPRVLLNFLRFIDSLNETNNGDETFMMDAIPNETLGRILSHSSIVDPTLDFKNDAHELVGRVMEHADLSG